MKAKRLLEVTPSNSIHWQKYGQSHNTTAKLMIPTNCQAVPKFPTMPTSHDEPRQRSQARKIMLIQSEPKEPTPGSTASISKTEEQRDNPTWRSQAKLVVPNKKQIKANI